MSSVIEITSAEFEEKVLRSPIPVMVDFYSVACHRCRLLAPTLAEVAGELNGQVAVYSVDAQEYGDLAQRFRITAVPTVSVFKQGHEVARLVGLQSRARLLEAVQRATSPPNRLPSASTFLTAQPMRSPSRS
jgi:thioredoxin 1